MPIQSDEERDFDLYLRSEDDAVLGCRAFGHRWPRFRPGAKYLEIQPQKDGVVEIVSTCSECGKKRRRVTAPGGALTFPSHYSYTKSPKSVGKPKGLPVLYPSAAMIEIWRRYTEAMK